MKRSTEIYLINYFGSIFTEIVYTIVTAVVNVAVVKVIAVVVS